MERKETATRDALQNISVIAKDDTESMKPIVRTHEVTRDPPATEITTVLRTPQSEMRGPHQQETSKSPPDYISQIAIHSKALGKRPKEEEEEEKDCEIKKLRVENKKLCVENSKLQQENEYLRGENQHLHGEKEKLCREKSQLRDQNMFLRSKLGRLQGKLKLEVDEMAESHVQGLDDPTADLTVGKR